MPIKQSEIRIIWLMLLTIVAVAAWYFDVRIISYLCALALSMSVMHYVDLLQQPTQTLSEQLQQPIQVNSKVPLYLSSMLAVLGGVMSWHWMTAAGITIWIFFFLRWLRRLEQQLIGVQYSLQHMHLQRHDQAADCRAANTERQDLQQAPVAAAASDSSALGFLAQLKRWIFQGNPVLKVAVSVLLIGIILLLRFATEHWQIDLALQLSVMAGLCLGICGLGYRLWQKNPSFALGLEALGLAGLFLCLFFAYYNQVLGSFWLAAVLFLLIMLLTLRLSLKQNSIELTLIGMSVAYIAPFTLPVREMSSTELVAYYVAINVAVAVLTSLRPWKILAQIALVTTVVIASCYSIYRGDIEQLQLTCLILIHSAIFIWLGFRYSQLMAKQDLAELRLKPVLDIALIFAAPLLGYGLIYLVYFENSLWQAGVSLGFALLFAGLHLYSKQLKSIAFIAQSYLSLMLIFISFIPSILLPEQWSVLGWATLGVLIFAYALWRTSRVAHYLAMLLLLVAGISSLYYWLQLDVFPRAIFWYLSLSYLTVVLIANARTEYREQYNTLMLVFHALLMFIASSLVLLLMMDRYEMAFGEIRVLLLISVLLLGLNEVMRWAGASWTWLLPKCMALIPIFGYALLIILTHLQHGQMLWPTPLEQGYFVLTGLLLFALSLRSSQADLNFAPEAVSLIALLSLALASLGIWSAQPYLSMLLLPLLLALVSFFRRADQATLLIWQSKTSLLLMMLWMMCSQLFSEHIFDSYWLPMLNPMDAISLLALLCFLWQLSLQLKTRLDRGIIAILAVLGLLWMSSYVLLRALHVYLHTAYNDMALWESAAVQLSLTLLWVGLAFVSMSVATAKKIRSLWILGASLLVIVTFKLVLLDLSHIGTLLRVFSFLGAGLVMLLIAYIAPMPELNEKSSQIKTHD